MNGYAHLSPGQNVIALGKRKLFRINGTHSRILMDSGGGEKSARPSP